MVKKNKRTNLTENEQYILPSSNEDMRTFIKKFKIDMMEHIVSSIKFAIENNLPIVEIFQFRDSSFVITISDKEFRSNLENIKKFYIEQQIYELYSRVEKLSKILELKHDEKEKSETNDDGFNESGEDR